MTQPPWLHQSHFWMERASSTHIGLANHSWSEQAATSAPVQEEAVQAILRMNQKHVLFPCPRIFQPPSLVQNFPLLPTSPLPRLTYLTSFPAHSIARAQESSQAWVAQSFKETQDTRLEECGEEKARRAFHPKQRSKRWKVSSLLSLNFFFLFVFFFFFCLRRRRW